MMTISRMAFPLALALLLHACGADGQRGAVAASAPAIGKADSQDAADRACQVVLRSVGRNPGGEDYELDCETGACLYRWRGTVAVADAEPYESSVRVMYRLASSGEWWEIAAEPAQNRPGYRNYAFSISEHLFGPDTPDRDSLSIDLVAVLVRPDGSRLFDHNHYRGDFENTVLSAANGYTGSDGGVCQPEVGRIDFFENFTHYATGARRQGAYLEITFDLDRLPECRNTHNGAPAWDTKVHMLFHPGEQLLSGSVRQFVTHYGTPTNQAVETPFWTRIPEDAAEVEIWFENFSGAGSSCHTWDSNYGQNYRFEIWPPADSPRCRDIEKETGARTEDYRMAHNRPYCVAYDVAENQDAAGCEFYLDGFGNGFVGHYGIPFNWYVAYLVALPAAGEVLNAGLWVRYRDNATGAEAQRFLLGIEEAPGVFRAGFAYLQASVQMMEGRDFSLLQFAFFMDVRRGDRVVRLWRSRHGANYSLADAFELPTYNEPIPYGRIQWADAAAGVFDSRRECH